MNRPERSSDDAAAPHSAADPATRAHRLEQLGQIVRTRRAELAAVARREGLSAEEAIECVQDALCTFLGSGAVSVEVLASLKTMVRNAARNFRRRHRRLLRHEPLDAPTEREMSPHSATSAEDFAVHAEDVARLRVCVAELCGAQRAVVTLRLLDEQSGEDAAAALGLSRAHVDVLVHRAKAALRGCMRDG